MATAKAPAIKRSKTVDGKVRDAWASLTVLAFENAKLKVKVGDLAGAEDAMSYFERWIDRAGARAVNYRSFY